VSVTTWLAFVTASAILLAIPGPTTLLVVSYALGHGRRRSGVATVAGVALGDLTAMTASILGLGIVLATSATIFTALKWVGAAYLIYLGVKLWSAPVAHDGTVPNALPVRRLRLFLHAYVVTALNPKSIVFFVAFLPQFLDASQPFLPQIIIMEGTFLALATLWNVTVYALLASAVRRTVRRPSVQRAINRIGGCVLIGAGILTATWRRATT
jgi:threonine/homoserine/homoserine lactone efflux protein